MSSKRGSGRLFTLARCYLLLMRQFCEEATPTCHFPSSFSGTMLQIGALGTALTPVELRPARAGDELAVATVNVRAWREGYRGLLPPADLDAMRAEDRAASYTFEPGAAYATQVAVDDGGSIVGFVTTAAARDDDVVGLGEVCAMYVDPDRWRGGVGSLLLDAAHRWLVAEGFGEAVLWFLAGNDRAEGFYRHHGWAPDGAERTASVWGVTAPERRLRRRLR